MVNFLKSKKISQLKPEISGTKMLFLLEKHGRKPSAKEDACEPNFEGNAG